MLNKTRRENYIAVYDTESSNPVLCSNRGVGGEVHEGGDMYTYVWFVPVYVRTHIIVQQFFSNYK